MLQILCRSQRKIRKDSQSDFEKTKEVARNEQENIS